MTNYLDELNKNQREAVEYIDGPSLVIAGAGSGKTKVLVSKITYLIEQGIRPWRILALTFTNKAAREMKERIALQTGPELASQVWAGTFHSIFARILRMEHQATGFSSDFTIYDTADQRSLLKAIVKEKGLDEKVYKPAVVAALISSAKNSLVLPEDYVNDYNNFQQDRENNMEALGDIYTTYWQRCQQAEAMDFDDLLLRTFMLFHNHPDICKKYADRFQFILVDEYQDTNYAQDRIVWELAASHQKVCVVGDDAQSIYSFRGANIDNILHFRQQYKGAKLFKLERNYRSTKNIVNSANSLISNNKKQIKKTTYSEKEEGKKLQVIKAFSDKEESFLVVKEIKKLHEEEQIPYDSFAILYRTNAQSRVFEEILRKQMLPYRIYGGLSFYQRKEIKDVIAYFRLAVNPHDEEAFKRVVNYPKRGIGQTTLNKLVETANEQNVSVWEVACQPDQYGMRITAATRHKLNSFTGLIGAFIEEAENKTAVDLGTQIIKESGIANDIYQDKTTEGLARQENLNELLNGLADYTQTKQEEGLDNPTLSNYLQEVSLLSDLDTDEGEDEEKITLMTIHASKGLEFPVVFVAGLEEELFPSNRSLHSPKALEEERRLCYVAITRAEKYCYLSYATSRMLYGSMVASAPSRFLKEIDSQYLEKLGTIKRTSIFNTTLKAPWDDVPSLSPKPVDKNLLKASVSGLGIRKLDSPATVEQEPTRETATYKGMRFSVGKDIIHARYGRGTVNEITGDGDDLKIKVTFESTGETKTLLVRFARMKPAADKS